MQQRTDGLGSWGLFPVDKGFSGLVFVLKLSEYVWLNNLGTDFYIPLTSTSSVSTETSRDEAGNAQVQMIELQGTGQDLTSSNGSMKGTQEVDIPEKLEPTFLNSPKDSKVSQIDRAVFTDEIINEIRSLVTDISSERGKGTKNKEARENILQEIEKLAAEAYSIFRSSIPTFVEESIRDAVQVRPTVRISSGTGSGYEVLCQGFNWESHKSGRWYSELKSKASELASLGFTIIWLPPPTESVSPEGYMPKDLYNLNSR